MVLAVDIGNTRVKAAVFEQDDLKSQFVFASGELQTEIESLQKKYPITAIVVSSVRHQQLDFLSGSDVNLHQISRNWEFPFENLYATPETLGIDRMVLSAGAVLSFPDTARLVIDAGTCITYDFIDSENRYQGGAISPGLRLRYKAMHEFTAKLPQLEPKWPDETIGKTTHEAMHNGAAAGLVFEIDGFIDSYRRGNPNFITILTGGDANFLAARLKNTIFASQNFLLESLNKTYQFQSRHDQ